MAVAIHQQMLYWQSALQGCELQPATEEVNIFHPREPSNTGLWSSQQPGALLAGARGSAASLALGFFLRAAASGLRLSPWLSPAAGWVSRGAQPWLPCELAASAGSSSDLGAGAQRTRSCRRSGAVRTSASPGAGVTASSSEIPSEQSPCS